MSSKTNKDDDDLEAHRVNIFLHAENVRVFKSPDDRELPVTILTGDLGAGKTTLLHHLLSNKSNLRIAAAINDFAALNIDENLIRHQGTASRLVELSNGCVCCHLMDDLKEAVWRLLDRSASGGSSDLDLDAVNYLVIETSGVSDPVRIIRTLDAKFGKCFRARLDSVVTVVDADHMLMSSTFSSGDDGTPKSTDHHDSNTSNGAPPSSRMSSAAVAQLACADVVLINKVDLLKDPETDCQVIEQRIRSINENAVLHRTTRCQIPLSAILDVQIPSTDTSAHAGPITHEKSEVPIYVSATGGALRSASSRTASNNKQPPNNITMQQPHWKADEFVSIAASHADKPLVLRKLQQFVCSPLVQQLTRMKGVLWLQGFEDYRCVIHLSGRGRLGFSLDGTWTGPPVSEMAFIGRACMVDREQLQAEFASCRTEEDDERGVGGNADALRNHPEFVVLEDHNSIREPPPPRGCCYFRLTGRNVYGYTEDEIEQTLRIDTNTMNRDLADAVNASVDKPKAFLAYTFISTLDMSSSSSSSGSDGDTSRVVLCYTGVGEPANNLQVLVREAKLVSSAHFRNVQVCKCGV